MKKNNVAAVKIEKIVIKIGEDQKELTIEEAKELQKVLNDLFGNKETIFVYPSSPYTITIPYTYPEPYTAPSDPPYYQPYKIWCTYWNGDTITVSNTGLRTTSGG